MFITLYQQTKNIQYSFDDLINGTTLQLKDQAKLHTIETTTPVDKPWSNHTLTCAKILKSLVHAHPEITTLTREEIAAQYTILKIPKKNGKLRTICAPRETLKATQRHIIEALKHMTHVHDSAYAYIEKRSIYNAIEQHQKNESKWFLKIDLKDFFGSCTEEFIYTQLKQIYPFALLTTDNTYDIIIRDIIKIACLNGILPQGNPIAPHLTNLIMVPIDYRLNILAPVYTRYSDDMLFSARTKIDMNLTIKNINEILKDTPLKINTEKTRLGSINGNNWNLGLMLNKDNNITLGHEKKRRYKATIDQYLQHPEKYTLQQTQKLAGLTAYYISIEPEYINYIINKYNTKHNKNLLYLLHHPL